MHLEKRIFSNHFIHTLKTTTTTFSSFSNTAHMLGSGVHFSHKTPLFTINLHLSLVKNGSNNKRCPATNARSYTPFSLFLSLSLSLSLSAYFFFCVAGSFHIALTVSVIPSSATFNFNKPKSVIAVIPNRAPRAAPCAGLGT
jgi:hypothetical protein